MESLWLIVAIPALIILIAPWLIIVLMPAIVLFGTISVPLVLWVLKFKAKINVLIVEGDVSASFPILEGIRKSRIPVDICFAKDGPEAVNALTQSRFDFLVLDYKVPGLLVGTLLQVANDSRLGFHNARSFKKFFRIGIWEKSLISSLLAKNDSGARILGLEEKNLKALFRLYHPRDGKTKICIPPLNLAISQGVGKHIE